MTRQFNSIRFSLGLKISLGMIAVTIASLIVLSIYFYQSIGHNITREKRQKLTSDRKVLEVLLKTKINTLQHIAATILVKPKLQQTLINKEFTALDSFLDSTAGDNQLDAVFVTDEFGIRKTGKEKDPVLFHFHSDDPFIRKALRGIATSGFDFQNNRMSLRITVPVFNNDQRLLGTLSLVYLFNGKTDLVDLAFDITRSSTLIVGDNRIIASSHLSEDRVIRFDTMNQMEVENISDRGHFYKVVIDKKLAYLAAGYLIHDIESKPIGLMLSCLLETPYVLSERNAVLELITIGCIYMLIIMVTVHFITKLFITEPLAEVLGVTNAIIKGDLSRKVRVQNQDELGILAVAFNQMTESLAKIQHKLKAQSKIAAIGQTTSMLAHDIRRPFNNLRSFLEMLPSHHNDTGFVEDRCKMILQSMETVSIMLDEMMELSSPAKLNHSWVNLNDYVKSVLSDLFMSRRAIPIELQLAIPPDLEIQIDIGKMQRALDNILNNAVEAMNNHGRIRITTVVEENLLTLQIANNGPPISISPLNNLFEPFVSKDKPNGTGLGLAITKHIIEAHEASIEVRNTPTGPEFIILFAEHNTRLSHSSVIPEHFVLFDLYKPSGEEALESDNSIEPVLLQKKISSALIVDDDQIQLDHIQQVVDETFPGCATVQCKNAETAYSQSLEMLFDLVITDFDLGPGSINGHDLIEKLQTILPDASYLLVSHKSIVTEKLNGNRQIRFHPKPLSKEKLLNALSQ